MSDSSRIITTALGVGCGILVGTMLLMTTCVGCAVINSSTSSNATIAKNTALDHLDFEDMNGKKERHYIRITGKLRNNGTTSVSFVKVGADVLDANGKVLDTDWTYAVDSEGLPPNAAKSFSIMIPTDSRMESFKYYVIVGAE